MSLWSNMKAELCWAADLLKELHEFKKKNTLADVWTRLSSVSPQTVIWLLFDCN